VRSELKVEIFADGASLSSIETFNANPLIKGFTTNPTLMKKDGVKDYKEHSLKIAELVNPKPVSFEVFSDDFDEMYDQAKTIAKWGENINVKIPISNTKGDSSEPLINSLAKEGVKLNITAIFTLEQVETALTSTIDSPYSIISIFAGRIADTGVDPEHICKSSVELKNKLNKNAKILWASPREVYNIFQADNSGCDIITVAHDILNKLGSIDKDLEEFSIETVKMFYNDASEAGYEI
jgi:transaldolase